MTTRANLSGVQFGPLFHGTNREFNPGDIISGASIAGVPPITKGLREDDPHLSVAHASESAAMAASYADRAVERGGGKFHLYRVKPVDPDDVQHELEDEMSSPSGFKVVRRLPIEHSQDPRVWTQHNRLQEFYERHY